MQFRVMRVKAAIGEIRRLWAVIKMTHRWVGLPQEQTISPAPPHLKLALQCRLLATISTTIATHVKIKGMSSSD